MDWKILGHEWAVELLSQQIKHQHIHHAYLFTGPTGIGRRQMALRLAQALNCPSPPQPGQPCLTCSTCTRIERLQHPDLNVIQAEKGSKLIKVEQVRDVQHSLALAPYEARYKIALFLDFQRTLPSVPNALLKTLEEPPAQVIIILTADDADNLLPTITSRCEVIHLRPLSPEKVSHNLQQEWGLSTEQANLLAHISGGLPIAALELNSQPELCEQRNQWLEDLHQLIGASRIEKFSYARTVKDDRESLYDGLRIWVTFWRDVLLTIVHSPVPLVNVDWAEKITNLAEQTEFAQACAVLARMDQTINRIEYSNINLQLALEALLLDIPTLQISN